MEMLKSYQIYKSKSFEMGIGIEASRFNHSCVSNAEASWNDQKETREIRVVSKIKAGEEITINYKWKQLSMNNVQFRQTFLLSNWGFICQCKLCEEENGQDEAKRYY